MSTGSAAPSDMPEKPLPKIVVIMGAGSSADFGVPILRGIFKNHEAAAYLNRDSTLHEWLQRVFWAPRGHSAATSDRSPTIEEMLTLIRDWQNEDTDAPDLRPVDDIRRRLYVLIYHAVYLNKSSNKAHLNGLIDTLRRSFSEITWASFNWDCIFESSYWYNSGTLHTGTRSNPHLVIHLDGWRDGFRKNTYLKLHGSVNWWRVNGSPTYLKWASDGDLAAKWKELEEGRTADRPIILEPSAYKYETPFTARFWNRSGKSSRGVLSRLIVCLCSAIRYLTMTRMRAASTHVVSSQSKLPVGSGGPGSRGYLKI